MTKADVVAAIVRQTYADKKAVEVVIESFFDVVKTSLTNNETIFVRGFGNFQNKKRNQKLARNIHTNTSIVVEPHLFPTFKPCKDFIAKVKESTQT